jgi:hypothetical protein
VLLGISVWIGWPVDKLWFVGLCIAIDFLCHGLSWSALALTEGKPLQVAVDSDMQANSIPSQAEVRSGPGPRLT